MKKREIKIRNIPEDVYLLLQAAAARENYRSMNQFLNDKLAEISLLRTIAFFDEQLEKHFEKLKGHLSEK